MVRNFLIYAVHSVYKQTTAMPFKGDLFEAKIEARKLLSKLCLGWTVKVVETDGQIIYSERFV